MSRALIFEIHVYRRYINEAVWRLYWSQRQPKGLIAYKQYAH